MAEEEIADSGPHVRRYKIVTMRIKNERLRTNAIGKHAGWRGDGAKQKVICQARKHGDARDADAVIESSDTASRVNHKQQWMRMEHLRGGGPISFGYERRTHEMMACCACRTTE